MKKTSMISRLKRRIQSWQIPVRVAVFLFLAGCTEQIRRRKDALLIAYRQLESSLDELSQQVEEERQRIDRALHQYGDPNRLR